ncbi:MAG TPA: SRPBCC domain-containing protein [Acidimicrobiia bacterium]|nr:SRPBCC domain-containing protein [Acidimicrobiia bacterium]
MADRPIDQEFTITRVFDAPRELVWKAWTDPDQMARWYGPRGISTPRSTITMDVRPGGTFELTMVDDADGSEYPSGGTFLEVEEPERLVWRDRDIDLLVTITFVDLGGRTEMTCHVAGRTGGAQAYDGWSTMFDDLAAFLDRPT